MGYSIQDLPLKDAPQALLEIPSPPRALRIAGNPPKKDNKILCVVGSRKSSVYGERACRELIAGLRGHPITIVSGLALGIDTVAHKAALDAGLETMAFPGSGLSPKVLYPSANLHLAESIIESGGGLISEFADDFRATPWSFPQRNRLMAGTSHAVLIVEAGEKSGTLITARLALDYNREVLVVPFEIFSSGARGSNRLLAEGAAPALSSENILTALGLEQRENQRQLSFDDLSPEELAIVKLLNEPREKDDIIRESKMPVSQAGMILSALEIKGYIKEDAGLIRLV